MYRLGCLLLKLRTRMYKSKRSFETETKIKMRSMAHYEKFISDCSVQISRFAIYLFMSLYIKKNSSQPHLAYLHSQINEIILLRQSLMCVLRSKIDKLRLHENLGSVFRIWMISMKEPHKLTFASNNCGIYIFQWIMVAKLPSCVKTNGYTSMAWDENIAV